MQGILFALVPMFAWGSIGFISNKIGGNPNQQTMGVTLGGLFFALSIYVFNRPALDARLLIFGILGGLLWSVGQNNQFRAMQYLGVSIGNPLSSGVQLVFGSLTGAIVFREWHRPLHYLLGLTAIVSLVVGLYFTAKKDKSEIATEGRFYNFTHGLRASIFSAAGYISYTILFNNIMKFDALTVLLPMSFGMILGAFAFSGFKVDFSPVVLKNSLVGIVWGIGNVFMLLAANTAGLAIAFSFSQLGALVAIVGGIFILHEKKTKKEVGWLLIGAFLFLVGAVLLGIIKSS